MARSGRTFAPHRRGQLIRDCEAGAEGVGIEEITERDGGGKGRFWGGDRQSHRGPALSLTGWGSSPRPQGKGVPSDSTTCHPLTTLPPSPGPSVLPPSPVPSTHSGPQPLARSFARLLASLPSLGYNFAQVCPLAVLHTWPWLPSREALSSVSLAHTAFPATLHGPVRSTLARSSLAPPNISLLKTSGPLLQTHLGHPSLTPSRAPCAHLFPGILSSLFSPRTPAVP